ncbi:unnamed protein product [Closterium sp. NIES-53]
MYLMTCTQPDLAYPLSILARYVAPGRHRPEHMAAAKRVLRYLCSTSGMGLVLGGRRPVVLTGHADASWADDQTTQWSSQGYTFSLGSGSVSWRSTRSSSVLSSSCEAEIYAGAMAAQELRWLTYLLTDLGEQPCSPPVLYVDNKAMLALCREHRLEHRTKHIALRYFLARELQQRGQLRLAYVASQANTADIFTKALPPGDHQRFCTMLVSWRSTRSSSVLGSSCEAEIYATAMAAQELRWLTDLGERPRSPPLLYVDNKAAIALCQEHRLEHRTKHIALRYFLARELQQRGQLRLAYVATRANTADIFTKALPPGDHQRVCTLLGLVPMLPHLLLLCTSCLALLPSVLPHFAYGEPWGAEPASAERGGAEPEGAESGGAEPRGTASSGGPTGALPQLSPRTEPLSPQQLREWFAQCTRLQSGAAGAGGSAAGGTRAGGVGATRLGGAGVHAGAGGTGGAAGPGGARTRGTRVSGTGGVGGAKAGGARGARAGDPGTGGAGAGGSGVGGAGAGGTGVGGAGAGGAGAGDTGGVDPGAGGAGAGGTGAVSGSTGAGGHVQRRPFFVLPHSSSLPPPDSSCPASPVCPVRTGHPVPRPRPPPVPSTHVMALRPSSVPLQVPLPPPFESSLLAVPDPESDLARAASPNVSRLLATVVSDPSFESTSNSTLLVELVDFAATYHLDYATSLVAESQSDCPPSVGGECALGTDVLEDRQEDFECLAAAVPHLVAMLLALERDPDAPDIPTPRSYAEAITGPYSSQWQTAMDAEMASCKSTGASRVGQHTEDDACGSGVLQRFRFRCSSPQSTPLPTGHSLSAPPSNESVEPSGPYPELVGYLMYLMTCTRPDLAYPRSILARYVAPGRHRPEHWEAAKRVLRYLCSTSGMGLVLGGRGPVVLTGHADAFWVDDWATQRSSQGYTFSLGSSSVSWRSTRSSSVLSSSCEAEIYVGAMAGQELRWLTYLLTDLGEKPRSPLVLYVDNKAMIALCQEHRLKHITKHIALRYFLARELELCLAYVATRANTADIFTKALQSGDHHRFSTVLGLVPILPHLLTA